MKAARGIMFAVSVVSLLVFAVGGARADWNEGDPAKWVQFPDISTSQSLDVNATFPKILADDFECTETGPITSIHIWGSWKQDWVPFGIDPTLVDFRLSIHSDVPAGVDTTMPWSHPGDLLWESFFGPGMFTVRDYAQHPQGWYDPNTGEYIPLIDHFGVWQYNFDLALAGIPAFTQQGTATDPVVYWLDVEAVPHDPDAWFGWKTSIDHWNDDATWADEPIAMESTAGLLTGGLFWDELRHPESNQSLDLAFVIVPEPVTMIVLGLGGLCTLISRRKVLGQARH